MHLRKLASLAELVLAFCARAHASKIQVSNDDFSTSDNTVVAQRVKLSSSTSHPHANVTGMFCKRDDPVCSYITQTPPVIVPGNWSNSAEPDISDAEYFRFSEENIEASQADDWYAGWSQLSQNKTEWAELGEWKLFAKDFAQTYNFECDLTFKSCINYPSLGDLQRMWAGPEHRALVRRIFFTFHRFTIAHDYVNAIEEAYDRTHVYLIGLVPEIISTFTKQVDAAKRLKCEQIHEVIDTAVTIGIGLMTQVFVGFAGPELASLSAEATTKMKELKTSLMTTTDEVARKSIQQQIKTLKAESPRGLLRWLDPPMLQTTRIKDLTQVKDEYTPPGRIGLTNTFFFQFELLVKMSKGIKNTYRLNSPSIGPGISNGGLCAEFEGDFVDQNPHNRDMLSGRLSSIFESTRKQRQLIYKLFYDGAIIEPGHPSGTAMWWKSRNWAGPGSVLDDMKDISAMEEAIKGALVKSLITDVLTSDFNYIKCGYKDDAAAHCKNAETATKGMDISVFCPHADTDPQFMCDSRRWYFTKKGRKAHDIPMVAAKKFETFANNRFQFTRQEFLMESFRNYELHKHNNPDDFGAWPYGQSSGASFGFSLPVCVSNKPRFFEKKGFPSICGDWRGEETLGFLEAMHAGNTSSILHYRDHNKPMPLHTSIIPVALDEFPPVTRYLGMCGNSIRFPYNNEQLAFTYQMQLSRDLDCELVENGTRDIATEQEANRWFCTNAGGHTIFQREAWRVDATSMKMIYAHVTKCAAWLKTNGMVVGDGARPGT